MADARRATRTAPAPAIGRTGEAPVPRRRGSDATSIAHPPWARPGPQNRPPPNAWRYRFYQSHTRARKWPKTPCPFRSRISGANTSPGGWRAGSEFLAKSIRQPARMANSSTGTSTTTGSPGQLDLLAESKRTREPPVANETPRRSSAELERLQRATADSLGALDKHTQGRLRELIEHAGDELAALIELVLNNREASA
jgi:hypothetical protein